METKVRFGGDAVRAVRAVVAQMHGQQVAGAEDRPPIVDANPNGCVALLGVQQGAHDRRRQTADGHVLLPQQIDGVRMPVGDVLAGRLGADDFVVACRLRNGGGSQVRMNLNGVLTAARQMRLAWRGGEGV